MSNWASTDPHVFIYCYLLTYFCQLAAFVIPSFFNKNHGYWIVSLVDSILFRENDAFCEHVS